MLDPFVHVVVHVMLQKPQALDGTRGHWYCQTGRPFRTVPTPTPLLRAYDAELAREGVVHDQFGFGTWAVGSRPDADVAFEEGDHIDVYTRLSQARRFLPPFLHRLRIDLDQREALGEIFGGSYGAPRQARTRITVTLPASRANVATLFRIHHIFGDAGRGGATQISDESGVHIYTGATKNSRPRIEAALRRAGYAYAEEPETFVTDDAPPCASI